MALGSAAVARLRPQPRSALPRFFDQIRVGVPASTSADRAEVQLPELPIVEFDGRVPAAVVERLEVDHGDIGGHELIERLVVRRLIPADARIFALYALLDAQPFQVLAGSLFVRARSR